MTKRKLLEDIKLGPSRFYRMPADVARDRRFGDEERLEILRAWAAGANEMTTRQIEDVITDMKNRRLFASGHAAE
jgi:hypothetical protein